MSDSIAKRDRFKGCLLGLAIGDAVGSPFEGLPAEAIFRGFGHPKHRIEQASNELLTYTDDTQMMIGVAECLLAKGTIDSEELADRFRENYEPGRGYGPGGQRILDAMKLGQDWREIVRTIFPGGSFGNGAAMRVAPVGLMFHSDLERLRIEAQCSAEVTHLHQLGIDGAVIIATGIAALMRDEGFNPASFFSEVLASATTEEFQWQLRTASRLDADSAMTFGSTLAAHRSVTTSIVCFTRSPKSFVDAISSAIVLGEDTDTVAAMAGALSGACLGSKAIPEQLLNRLEDGPKGRRYIEKLADDLYDQWSRIPA